MVAALKSVLKWAAGVLFVVLSGLALVGHWLSGSKSLGKAAVDAIEAAHKPRLDVLGKQIQELQKDSVSNARAIADAQREVQDRKQDLVNVYQQTGMSVDEAIKRLSDMRV